MLGIQRSFLVLEVMQICPNVYQSSGVSVFFLCILSLSNLDSGILRNFKICMPALSVILKFDKGYYSSYDVLRLLSYSQDLAVAEC